MFHFEQLKAGSALELPFWLAGQLSDKCVLLSVPRLERELTSTEQRRDMIDLTLPRAYSPMVRNALQASPESVHLRNLGGGGGSFYAGGMRLLSLCVFLFPLFLPPFVCSPSSPSSAVPKTLNSVVSSRVRFEHESSPSWTRANTRWRITEERERRMSSRKDWMFGRKSVRFVSPTSPSLAPLTLLVGSLPRRRNLGEANEAVARHQEQVYVAMSCPSLPCRALSNPPLFCCHTIAYFLHLPFSTRTRGQNREEKTSTANGYQLHGYCDAANTVVETLTCGGTRSYQRGEEGGKLG